jgi:hypothetical protein
MREGYVKQYRQLLNSDIWQSGDLALGRVWQWCLLKATYRNFKAIVGSEVISLQPGQFVCGELKGAEECKIPASTFRKKLILLKKLDTVALIRKRHYTLVTIVNWATYQMDGSVVDAQRERVGSELEDIQEGKKGREDKEKRKETDTSTLRVDKAVSSETEEPEQVHQAIPQSQALSASDCRAGAKPAVPMFDRNARFEEAWAAYPLKLGKKVAARHFAASVKCDVDFLSLMRAMSNYKVSPNAVKEGGKYIQHGSTWFNCWEEWVVPPKAPSARQSSQPQQTGRPYCDLSKEWHSGQRPDEVHHPVPGVAPPQMLRSDPRPDRDSHVRPFDLPPAEKAELKERLPKEREELLGKPVLTRPDGKPQPDQSPFHFPRPWEKSVLREYAEARRAEKEKLSLAEGNSEPGEASTATPEEKERLNRS